MEELPDFTGKVVSLYLSHSPVAFDGGCLLEYAKFEKQGGRLFVVGRIPQQDEDEWVSNLPAAVAWDAVSTYLVFDSKDDFRSRVKRYKPSLRERLFGRRGA